MSLFFIATAITLSPVWASEFTPPQSDAVDLSVRLPGKKKQYKSVQEVLANFTHEPDVRAVQQMAMSYTKTNPALVEAWMSASKNAYILPAVTLSYDKDLDYYDSFSYSEDDAGSFSADPSSTRADNDDRYGVRLSWKLDKIVMSSERIRVIDQTQDIVKLRDKVLDEVTRLYFDRRRLQVDTLLNPPTSLNTQLKNELRLQEVTASLDSLTGGAFSRQTTSR